MDISMGLLKELLALPAAASRPGRRWEDFRLRGWSLRPGSPDRVWVTDARGLAGAAPLPPGQAAVCAGVPSVWPPEGEILCVSCGLPALEEAVNALFSRLQELDARLARAVYAEHSLQQVLELLGPLFGGRLTALSADLQLLAEYESGSSPPFPAMTELEDALAGVLHEREPFLFRPEASRREYLCVNVFFQQVAVCRLIHIVETGVYPPARRELLRRTAEHVQTIFELSAGRPGREPTDRLGRLAAGLLAGDRPRRDAVEEALRFRGWRRDDPFLCAVILPAEGDAYGPPLSYHFRLLRRMISHSYVLEDGGDILCVVWLPPYGGTVDGFMERNVELLRDGNYLAGLSQVFTDFSELAAARKQAQIALRIGLRVRPTIWYHRFGELALPYFWDRLGGELEPRYVAAPQILRLREYDRQNGTEYARTLRTYLRCGLNAALAAKELFIHRGTMNYRLRRIRELTSLTLDEPDTRLYLEISFRLLEYRELPESE